MYQNIPAELQSLLQWVVWRYEMVDGRQTKVPYCAKTGHLASITNPKTWTSFQEAIAAAPKYSGIGLVLTDSDPYTGIDIDNKPENPATEEDLKVHAKILAAFQSYTEKSVGGNGYHIIVRGRVPQGSDRGHVGVYSTSRYLTFTGQVVKNLPITECQNLLDHLYQEMQPAPTVELVEQAGHLEDGEIVDMAMSAVNGDKFTRLCNGDMAEYPSQSEADFALLAILAFYTPSNEQVRRIFRMTALGKRAKATNNDTYLNFALQKIRAQQPPPMDAAQLIANANVLMQPKASEPEEAPPPKPLSTVSLPPGLIGDMAQYFYQTAVRPVPEIALCAAIALAAGVAGRSFNISGSGLNQYLIILARTGSGKEGALSGIENLITAVRPTVPMVDQFMGPAGFASGQGLIKKLTERPCFVSVLGEFGLTLQQISDHRANSAEKMLKKVLLDLYSKSGWNRTLQSTVYSDVEKNTATVQAPCVTILGESTPETFFEGLDASHIAEGLIPRFSIVEYTGPRPARNRDANVPPSKPLVQRFSDLLVASISATNNGKCVQVEMDNHSLKLMDDFDAEADARMNSSKAEVEIQVWNRAHLKALKLAALIAVGINPYAPIITAEVAQWAIAFVVSDVRGVAMRFREGDVGQGDNKQLHDLKKAVENYFNPSSKSKDAHPALKAARIIPYQQLIRRTAAVASFRNDKLGSTTALKKTLQAMIDSGMLVEIAKPTLLKDYGYSGAAYGIGTHWN